MSRIQTCFAALARDGRRALIPFITAGYPSPDLTVSLMHALVAGGTDVIELGVPFSDPMADGPVIQRASEQALAQGMSLLRVLECVREFRTANATTPVVLMAYANPIEAMGQEAFIERASEAGVDGVLVLDYTPQECGDFARMLQAANMDMIFLLAPTSTDQRLQEVARLGSGYIYYVSLTGVTGSGALDLDAVVARIPALRKALGLPVGVGFGIRDAASAKRIGEVADAVVIGSRLIDEVTDCPPGEAAQRVQAFMQSIRTALDELPALGQSR